MKLTQKETTNPAYELTWSIETQESVLTLAYAITAREELYVTDRVWDFTKEGKRIDDPFGAYRFMREDNLRLVFEQPPIPEDREVSVYYTPLSSRIAAGDTHERQITLAVPVDEYSALGGRAIDAPTTEVVAESVTLVMGYRLRSSMEEDPIPPAAEDAGKVGYVVWNPKRIISTIDNASVRVKMRNGPIPRYRLPGDDDT